MALIPSATYPGQIATGDAGYPHGKAQNVTVDGDGTGTPLEADLVNDIFGFQQALLVEGVVTPSGDPDEVGASDYVTALHAVCAQHAHSNAIANHVARTPDLGFASQFMGIAHTGTRFVAVGQTGEIQTSPEAITWTARTPAAGFTGPTNTFRAIYADTGFCVAVGSQDMIQTSTGAGVTWTQRTPGGGAVGTTFYGVAKSVSTYVAVGDPAGGLAAIQSSTDGTTWTARTPDGAFAGTFNAIAYGGGVFVAVGSTGMIQTSPDGTTWTQTTADAGYVGTFFAVAYGPHGFVAAGTLGEIQSSPDGITWTTRADPSYTGTWTALCWTGRVYLLLGASEDMQTSPTGQVWTLIGRAAYAGTTLNAGVAGDGTVVMVGTTGTIRQSLVIHS